MSGPKTKAKQTNKWKANGKMKKTTQKHKQSEFIYANWVWILAAKREKIK